MKRHSDNKTPGVSLPPFCRLVRCVGLRLCSRSAQTSGVVSRSISRSDRRARVSRVPGGRRGSSISSTEDGNDSPRHPLPAETRSILSSPSPVPSFRTPSPMFIPLWQAEASPMFPQAGRARPTFPQAGRARPTFP